MKNKPLTTLINEILDNKEIVNFYREIKPNRFSIEIESRNPISFESLYFKTEQLLDQAFSKLDATCLIKMKINPYKIRICE